MGWVAEILREKHRVCAVCRMGPTHVLEGEPLCNACLAERLVRSFSHSTGRLLVFEPSLGPDAYLFHRLDAVAARAWPETQRAEARAALDRIEGRCDDCPGAARCLWVPVERDANLWSEDWLAELERGELKPAAKLCGPCAARRLSRSIEQRGLFFEAIDSPRDADGVMFGAESPDATPDGDAT